ncbi:hypothetical protein HPB49_003230 [Dermacentor silvarum]|uniref:Uncharacterized protein n=1 Tax=Dermacentor silvarum TaxID=543639 RepID=A0ACB8C730_DERSI|nr:hypothetical protein HPB49_003230 [Dermacentor silvarum]
MSLLTPALGATNSCQPCVLLPRLLPAAASPPNQTLTPGRGGSLRLLLLTWLLVIPACCSYLVHVFSHQVPQTALQLNGALSGGLRWLIPRICISPQLSSPMRDPLHALSRLELEEVTATLNLFSDQSLEVKCSLQSLQLEDTRSDSTLVHTR